MFTFHFSLFFDSDVVLVWLRRRLVSAIYILNGVPCFIFFPIGLERLYAPRVPCCLNFVSYPSITQKYGTRRIVVCFMV